MVALFLLLFFPSTSPFYENEHLEPSKDIAIRIEKREKVLMEKLRALFGNGGENDE